MKPNKKILATLVIILCIALYGTSFTGEAEAQQDFGAVLVAHGSKDRAWNKQVEDFYDSVSKKISDPLKLAYLLSPPELDGPPKPLTEAVQQLQSSGVTKIVLIHLSPSSCSERHQEIVDFATATMIADPALRLIVPPAMDKHTKAVEILTDYADKTSGQSGIHSREPLILLAYGANAYSPNRCWETQLINIGNQIKQTLGFKQVETMTLRRAAPQLHVNAVNQLKHTAQLLGKVDRVIVVPYVMCNNTDNKTDFHEEVKSYLKGMAPDANIVLCEKGVIDHIKTEEWVLEVIDNERALFRK